jgi:hypothetical protein
MTSGRSGLYNSLEIERFSNLFFAAALPLGVVITTVHVRLVDLIIGQEEGQWRRIPAKK